MKSVLSMGWQLICFRVGPEALPYRPNLVLPLILLNLAISLGLQELSHSGMDRPVLQLSLMALMAEALWLWLWLRRRGWQARWVQGYTGLVLVDTLITILAAPLVVLLIGGGQPWLNIAAALQIVLTFWSLSARSFVYQHTLEISRWRGLLMALAPLFMVMALTLAFFPELVPMPPTDPAATVTAPGTAGAPAAAASDTPAAVTTDLPGNTSAAAPTAAPADTAAPASDSRSGN